MPDKVTLEKKRSWEREVALPQAEWWWEIPGLVFCTSMGQWDNVHICRCLYQGYGDYPLAEIPFSLVSHCLGLSTWCMCLWRCRLQSVNPVVFSWHPPWTYPSNKVLSLTRWAPVTSHREMHRDCHTEQVPSCPQGACELAEERH